MGYRVEVVSRARLDVIDVLDFIALDSPLEASRWNAGFLSLLDSLTEMPRRFPQIPEAEHLGVELRAAHFHSHRVVFRVDDERALVQILRVYHAFRRAIEASDVSDFPG